MNCLYAIPDSKMRWCLHERLLASSTCAKRSWHSISSALLSPSRLERLIRMTPASFALALDDWAQKSMNARMEWRFAQYERRSVCGIQGPLTRQLKKVVMPTTIERRCSVVMSGGSVRRCREIHGQQKGTAPAAL